MGKDSYFTHKYLSVSTKCLVLRRTVFILDLFYFSSIIQHQHRSVLLPVIFSSSHLLACLCLYSNIQNSSKLHADGRLADVTPLSLNTLTHLTPPLWVCVCVYVTTQPVQWEKLIKTRCPCMHIDILSCSVFPALTYGNSFFLTSVIMSIDAYFHLCFSWEHFGELQFGFCIIPSFETCKCFICQKFHFDSVRFPRAPATNISGSVNQRVCFVQRTFLFLFADASCLVVCSNGKRCTQTVCWELVSHRH